MRHGGVVEEHIDPAEGRDREINKSLAVRRRRQVAWMPGHHRSACGAHGLNGRFRRVDVQIAGGRRDLPAARVARIIWRVAVQAVHRHA
jgi:hypothetical protein